MENRKRKRRRQKSAGKIIWCFNLVGILLILICWLVLQAKEEESGLTFAKLYFDEEYAQYRGTIPDSLLGLMEKNPETKEFVLHYPEYEGYDENLDLSGEVGEGIPLFLQWDERWGYESYGDQFLALTGCGPTCLSMVYCGLSGNADFTPYDAAVFAEEGGYYVSGSGSSWELMSSGAQMLGLTVHDVVFDSDHIKEALLEGEAIICAMRPGDFTTTGHFIVLAGLNEEGNFVVNDPNSIINSEKAWTPEELLHQIKNLWGYSYDM